jgi:hypothetical protein
MHKALGVSHGTWCTKLCMTCDRDHRESGKGWKTTEVRLNSNYQTRWGQPEIFSWTPTNGIKLVLAYCTILTVSSVTHNGQKKSPCFKSLELKRKFIGHLSQQIFRIHELTVEMVQYYQSLDNDTAQNSLDTSHCSIYTTVPNREARRWLKLPRNNM